MNIDSLAVKVTMEDMPEIVALLDRALTQMEEVKRENKAMKEENEDLKSLLMAMQSTRMEVGQ